MTAALYFVAAFVSGGVTVGVAARIWHPHPAALARRIAATGHGRHNRPVTIPIGVRVALRAARTLAHRRTA